MKVKDIIVCALRCAGRPDVADALSDGQTIEGEKAEAVRTMLYCFNAVEDELARCYFPILKSEDAAVQSGKVGFTSLSESPVKILGVKSGGKPVKYKLEPQYIEVNADTVTVEYFFTPSAKTIDGDSAYDGCEVGERLVAAGAASEYCLLNGESAAARLWESKYRDAIDSSRASHRRKRSVPPRRWV